MDATTRRQASHILNWTLDYLENNDAYPVFPADIEPGDIADALEPSPPVSGTSLETCFNEFLQAILTGVTHWNHPGFFAYFNSSATVPAVMAELLSAAINTNCMVWKASPAGTEVEQTTLSWLQQICGLSGFTGITFDGGASSSFHALAAMREKVMGPAYRKAGLMGAGDFKPRVYITEQTHNSIHKALITLGFGTDSIRRVDVTGDFAMDCGHLEQLIAQDRSEGNTPVCVVGTLGTTSCTALDPVQRIAEICKQERLWFHVDAAHGGGAAVLDTVREQFKGWEKADSILINPHKWMFIPIDLSVLFIREPGLLKNAFHYAAEYLKTPQDGIIDNFMDYGIPLGRRFRCLKLWFSLTYHGVDYFREKISRHMELSDRVYAYIASHKDFEIMAPKPLSTTCFRAVPGKPGCDMDAFNEALMDAVNRTGRYFISHTRLKGEFVLRHVVSGVKTTAGHIEGFLQTLGTLKSDLEQNWK